MNADSVEKYCLVKKHVSHDYPFGPDVHVFRVAKKMFALISEKDERPLVNLKCDPDEAIILRDIFKAVEPGYHTSKVHWNTVYLDGDVPDGELKRMIDNSYQLVLNSLPKKLQLSLS